MLFVRDGDVGTLEIDGGEGGEDVVEVFGEVRGEKDREDSVTGREALESVGKLVSKRLCVHVGSGRIAKVKVDVGTKGKGVSVGRHTGDQPGPGRVAKVEANTVHQRLQSLLGPNCSIDGRSGPFPRAREPRDGRTILASRSPEKRMDVGIDADVIRVTRSGALGHDPPRSAEESSFFPPGQLSPWVCLPSRKVDGVEEWQREEKEEGDREGECGQEERRGCSGVGIHLPHLVQCRREGGC